jgi:hypothetical protein
MLTIFVRFDSNALDINPGRGSMTMSERVLGLTEGPRAPGHHPRECVAHLAQMNLADPRLPGVTLQVLDEGSGGELRARLPGAVVPGHLTAGLALIESPSLKEPFRVGQRSVAQPPA